MFNFSFYNPINKNLRDYIKLSNNLSINKIKERNSLKPIYKINYDFTSLSDCETTLNKTNYNENQIVIKTELFDNNINNKFKFIYFIKTIIVFSISFVIYKKILKRD